MGSHFGFGLGEAKRAYSLTEEKSEGREWKMCWGGVGVLRLVKEGRGDVWFGLRFVCLCEITMYRSGDSFYPPSFTSVTNNTHTHTLLTLTGQDRRQQANRWLPYTIFLKLPAYPSLFCQNQLFKDSVVLGYRVI